jgi:hypothetical protein
MNPVTGTAMVTAITITTVIRPSFPGGLLSGNTIIVEH